LFGSDQRNDEKNPDADGRNKSGDRDDSEKSQDKLDNPFQIGGNFYYRFIASPQRDVAAIDMPISLPLQLDAFLDGRPNDRIRVFVNARLLYDATRDKYSQTTKGTNLGSTQTSSTATVTTTTNTQPNNPDVALDQAWLKFDILRTVFVTAGNQHVKWGTSRFWNPTDFINTQKRDPLLQQDLRLGLPMLRFDVPLQFISSNFSAMAFFNQPQPASTAGQLGGAARYEILIGETEIGFDVVYRDHEKYKDNLVYGVDLSSSLGPFDVYAEGACITRQQSPHYTLTDKPIAGKDLSQFFTSDDLATPLFEASGGLNFSFGWLENRQATLGAEYFYNQTGYASSSIYPILILNGQYQPFYVGQHYAAVYLVAEGPDAGKHTSYTLSVLSNLSDKSLIGRIDFTWNFLNYMNFQFFVDGRFGAKGGEFNFALDTPALTYKGGYIPAINIPETIFDVGLALQTRF
ncbi:MAG: hypothetical protein OEV66_08595, partial [Spirochaetia bacterium]|nr:hypothetical protein [Spirochaetia bacterium]